MKMLPMPMMLKTLMRKRSMWMRVKIYDHVNFEWIFGLTSEEDSLDHVHCPPSTTRPYDRLRSVLICLY
ncbi:hypothetical protein QR98_0029440 [Sarcoptes scabiei]|uniref:Uncharacterized protein n=1 Tax=Sarcoptes scabiei TaxID=52283 RepID=A0A132A1P6_SARSC|nr:hypothetical protein QR98_0029440 [Sarcoptes scabiei]